MLWEKKERQKEGESVGKWTGRRRERGLGGARVRKKGIGIGGCERGRGEGARKGEEKCERRRCEGIREGEGEGEEQRGRET